MRVKWVLIGFGILYLVVALSFFPMDKFASPEVAEIWSIFAAVVWAPTLLISIGLLEAMTPFVRPFVHGGGFSQIHAEEGLLALICIGIAAVPAVRLVRKDITPGRRGTYVFLLLLTLSLVAGVRFTMYSWAHFGS
jgi:hypothetical protein